MAPCGACPGKFVAGIQAADRFEFRFQADVKVLEFALGMAFGMNPLDQVLLAFSQIRAEACLRQWFGVNADDLVAYLVFNRVHVRCFVRRD